MDVADRRIVRDVTGWNHAWHAGWKTASDMLGVGDRALSGSSTRIALAFAIVLCAGQRAAHADGPVPDVGVRAGFAEQASYGGTHFAGNGVDLGLEVGARVNQVFTIRIGFEQGPRIVHSIPAGSDGDVEFQDDAIIGVAEYHLDPLFVGVGGGWLRESSTSETWTSDGLGPIGPGFDTYARTGQLVLARAGMQLGVAARLSVNLVLQLTAQQVTSPAHYPEPSGTEHGYGASLGLEIRGLAGRTPSNAPPRRSHSLFVGADVGLTGTLNGSTEDFTAWDTAAPLAGLDLGGYITPSFAFVLGAAGAPDLRAGRFDNNQARFTIGAEAHHHTLFASAGGGVSRYTLKWAQRSEGYRYDHTSYSKLLYLGAGVELPRGIVRYRLGGEVEMFDVEDDLSSHTVYAFTLTFGARLSNAR